MKKEKPSASLKTDVLSTDWFTTHPHSQQRKALLPVTHEARQFLTFTWPISSESYNPLNAIFSMQCLHLDLLNRQSSWLFRDGLVPLLWFFRTHPDPKNLQSKIYIHEELVEFVPPAWRDHVGSYRLVSQAAGNGSRKLLLVGVMAEPFMTVKELEIKLKTLQDKFGDELKELEKSALIIPKSWGYGTENDHQYAVEYTTRLCSVFGTEMKALHWRQFESMDHFHGYEVISLNDHYLIADDHAVGFAASRGARLFAACPSNDTSEKFVRLSPYHGYALQAQIPQKSTHPSSADTKASEKYLRAMNSEAHVRMPWPQWFSDWVKTQNTVTASATANTAKK